MIVAPSKPLFAWDCLEDSPSLKTIRELLATLPDAKLLESLRAARGKGRDDDPIHVLWGVVVLTVALRHPSTEACLAELKRNEPLRRLIGIESEDQVPSKWNLSRFEETLGEEPHRSHLKMIFQTLVERLGGVVPDLGQDTAGDATALSAKRSRSKSKKNVQAEAELPQPTGGRKEYADDEGKVTKVVEWFGFKLHLLVDVKHEVALSYEITSANVGDGETLPALVKQAQAVLPEQRMQTLAYDKAADSNDVHELLDAADIQPLIQIRSLWQSEHERPLPGHDGRSNVVYESHRLLTGYFRHNLHRMDFSQYVAKGWQIGSGKIESMCKSVVVQRLKGPGMHWREPGTKPSANSAPSTKANPPAGAATGTASPPRNPPTFWMHTPRYYATRTASSVSPVVRCILERPGPGD